MSRPRDNADSVRLVTGATKRAAARRLSSLASGSSGQVGVASRRVTEIAHVSQPSCQVFISLPSRRDWLFENPQRPVRLIEDLHGQREGGHARETGHDQLTRRTGLINCPSTWLTSPTC